MNVHSRQIASAGIRLSLLLLFIVTCRGATIGQPRKIIIDCDPGIDDAVALIIALQYPGFEILGITTTFGNATLKQATRNALRVVELSGKAIPVYQGAGKPMIVPMDPPP